MQLTVFFDFLCPYAWRASRWLDMVVAQRPEVVIDWRYFSLEQVNTPADSAWKVWEQDGDGYARHDGTTTWVGCTGFGLPKQSAANHQHCSVPSGRRCMMPVIKTKSP
jgi:hypothetical protein